MRCLVQKQTESPRAAEVEFGYGCARVKFVCKSNCAGCSNCRTRSYSITSETEDEIRQGKYALLWDVEHRTKVPCGMMVKRLDVPIA